MDSKIVNLQKTISTCNIRLENCNNIITNLLNQTNEINDSGNSDNQNKLAELKAKLVKEEDLLKQFQQDVEKELEGFSCTSRDYGECFHEIKAKYTEMNTSTQALSENKAKLEEFLKDKDKTKLFAKIEIDFTVEELQENKHLIDEKRLKCIKDISDKVNYINLNDEKADDLFDFESELLTCEESKDRLVVELDTLKKTINFLKEANDNLANQYLTPLLEKTRAIIKLYDQQKSDLEVDANSKILIKEKGKDRELDYFSKGIKELISICMRISLIEIIYGDNPKKPFIILDDPFVNLDDKKLESAKDFIKKLSLDYQIIYLTCHDSRKIAA